MGIKLSVYLYLYGHLTVFIGGNKCYNGMCLLQYGLYYSEMPPIQPYTLYSGWAHLCA